MPFKSIKQKKYLYAKKPKVAKKFAKHSKPKVVATKKVTVMKPKTVGEQMKQGMFMKKDMRTA